MIISGPNAAYFASLADVSFYSLRSAATNCETQALSPPRTGESPYIWALRQADWAAAVDI